MAEPRDKDERPVLASLLEGAGYPVRDAFLATAALCVVSAVLFLLLDSPIKAGAINRGPEAPSRITLAALSGVLTSRAILPVVMVCLGSSVFAGLNNFQTVFADARGLDYASFFLTYTVTVVVFRLVLARFRGGPTPYLTIALLQYVMCLSIVLFIFSGASLPLYLLVAILFGIGGMLLVPVLSLLVAQIIGATELVESAERSPVWLIAAGVLTAAVTEEVLYRAAPIELLLRRGAPQWLAALLPLIVFVICHLGSWNLAHIVGVVIPMGILLSLLYLWRRSLTVNIVAHLIIDVPLIVIALAAG